MLKMWFPQNYNNSRDKLDLKNIMPVNYMSSAQNDGWKNTKTHYTALITRILRPMNEDPEQDGICMWDQNTPHCP
jgi:hypothetical protein